MAKNVVQYLHFRILEFPLTKRLVLKYPQAYPESTNPTCASIAGEGQCRAKRARASGSAVYGGGMQLGS